MSALLQKRFKIVQVHVVREVINLSIKSKSISSIILNTILYLMILSINKVTLTIEQNPQPNVPLAMALLLQPFRQISAPQHLFPATLAEVQHVLYLLLRRTSLAA